MTQYIEKYKKNIVIDMRKKGYSYSEIQNSIHVPKSTIAYWLRDVKLTREQLKKMKIKQLDTLRVNSQKIKNKTSELIAEIKSSSSKQVKEISKREFWLMGVMLYWKERLLLNNENDLKKGINFTSSDPYLIKFFLKWLVDLGAIKKDEIKFDIFLNKFKKASEAEKIKKLKDVIRYWGDVTGAANDEFVHIYFKELPGSLNKGTTIKKRRRRKTKNIPSTDYKKAEMGYLRIRVLASSMLARQIAGWVKGVRQFYWKD